MPLNFEKNEAQEKARTRKVFLAFLLVWIFLKLTRNERGKPAHTRQTRPETWDSSCWCCRSLIECRTLSSYLKVKPEVHRHSSKRETVNFIKYARSIVAVQLIRIEIEFNPSTKLIIYCHQHYHYIWSSLITSIFQPNQQQILVLPILYIQPINTVNNSLTLTTKTKSQKKLPKKMEVLQ